MAVPVYVVCVWGGGGGGTPDHTSWAVSGPCATSLGALWCVHGSAVCPCTRGGGGGFNLQTRASSHVTIRGGGGASCAVWGVVCAPCSGPRDRSRGALH